MLRLGAVAALVLGLVAAAAAAAPIDLEARYVTADRVYVDGGSRLGLEAGDRLDVVRDGTTVATLEVTYSAPHSASCRVVGASAGVVAGDVVRWTAPVGGRPMPASAVRQAPAPSAPPPAVVQQRPPPPAPRVPLYRGVESPPPALRSSVSGSLSFDWEQRTDDSDSGRDFDRTAARVSLRGRNLSGLPLQLRLRGSTRSVDRVVSADGASSITDTRDRLYEASLAYEPEEGRFALRLGRLRLGRYAGAGTIDGASAEARIGRVFHLGLFGGSRSDLSDFGIDGDRTNYGVTARWTGGERGRRELLVAGVREDGVEDVSREYVAVQTRLGGERWSFYQRAELDLNNGWRREASGSASQLSTLFLNATARVSARNRLSLSYSQFERYRTEETRLIPEELFDENARQGLRLRWMTGNPGGLNANLSAGVRERDGDDDEATSAGFGVHHNNLFGKRFSLGLNLLAFSNGLSDGSTAIFTAGKRLRGGHHVTLTAGGRSLDDPLRDGETRDTQWLRLGGWFELPGNLYGRSELEVTSGDDLEGQRILIGLGYRL